MGYTLNGETAKKLDAYIACLRGSMESFGVPEFMDAFHDADDYHEFDVDPESNYLTGCIQGIADAMGVAASTLVYQRIEANPELATKTTGKKAKAKAKAKTKKEQR